MEERRLTKEDVVKLINLYKSLGSQLNPTFFIHPKTHEEYGMLKDLAKELGLEEDKDSSDGMYLIGHQYDFKFFNPSLYNR